MSGGAKLLGNVSVNYTLKPLAEPALQLALQHHQARRYPQAEAVYETILRAHPEHADTLGMLALLQHQTDRTVSAIETMRRALRVRPDYAELHSNLGNLLRTQGRWQEAVDSYREALRLKPGYAKAHLNLGNACRESGALDDAIACYRLALALDAEDAAVHSNLGAALKTRGALEEAVTHLQRALALDPKQPEAHYNLGNAWSELKRADDAVQAYRNALALRPDYTEALCALLRRLQVLCVWEEVAVLSRRLLEPIHVNSGRLNMFTFVSLEASPATQLKAAQTFALRESRGLQSVATARRSDPARLRIGYVSADFREHPVAYLTAELFELHDRSRFEVIGYSVNGGNDESPMRTRIRNACDRFQDVENQSSIEIARAIAADGIDILVDLTGYTTRSPHHIFAQRPAPVQVNFLGYPGTLGAPYIDYIITDHFVTPPEHQPYYSEKFVYLPYCFQPNDRKRMIAEPAPDRAACGLPETGFVFCCFNQTYKITGQIFASWMRLLEAIPGSVLWLSITNPQVRTNLQNEARRRGIATARLVFADWMPTVADHLARYRNADLFLDTWPFNAHTTASDALWAGLPMITCVGETFAARVAGSLLHAVGLSELVTHTLAEYESMALRLARKPQLLAGYRRWLEQNRLRCPLFDSARYAGDLERAYQSMWDRHQQGAPPEMIEVNVVRGAA